MHESAGTNTTLPLSPRSRNIDICCRSRPLDEVRWCAGFAESEPGRLKVEGEVRRLVVGVGELVATFCILNARALGWAWRTDLVLVLLHSSMSTLSYRSCCCCCCCCCVFRHELETRCVLCFYRHDPLSQTLHRTQEHCDFGAL